MRRPHWIAIAFLVIAVIGLGIRIAFYSTYAGR
jgi:hypothetical protein